jgi:large subunit ribosomal protein L22
MKRYAFGNYNKEHMARAVGIGLPISYKQSVEICNFIRHKNAIEAKKLLTLVAEKKIAVPYKRFNMDTGHKKGIGPGRYPQKASKEFINLIENVEANAQFKGINTSNLTIIHLSSHKGGKAWHYGRQSRTKMKRTTVEIYVEESKKTEDKKQSPNPKTEKKIGKAAEKREQK